MPHLPPFLTMLHMCVFTHTLYRCPQILSVYLFLFHSVSWVQFTGYLTLNWKFLLMFFLKYCICMFACVGGGVSVGYVCHSECVEVRDQLWGLVCTFHHRVQWSKSDCCKILYLLSHLVRPLHWNFSPDNQIQWNYCRIYTFNFAFLMNQPLDSTVCLKFLSVSSFTR